MNPKTLLELKDHLAELELKYGVEYLAERIILVEDEYGRDSAIVAFNDQNLQLDHKNEIKPPSYPLDW